MRAAAFAALLIFIFWLAFVIRMSNVEFATRTCAKLCDSMFAREPGTVVQGFVTYCKCGKLKPAPKTMRQR